MLERFILINIYMHLKYAIHFLLRYTVIYGQCSCSLDCNRPPFCCVWAVVTELTGVLSQMNEVKLDDYE